MKVHHLNCGSMPMGLVNHCALIETGNSLVLIDSGFGTECVQRTDEILGLLRHLFRPALDVNETVIRQIEKLGFSATDVRHIVLTHLDFDHAGGISDFPWARVHVHGPEFRAAMKPSSVERMRYRPSQWKHPPRWALNEVGDDEQWFGLPAIRDLEGLPPEIVVVPLYGHTRGHVGVAIDTGTGWLLHAGDSYLTQLQFNRLLPGLFLADAAYGVPDLNLALSRLISLRRLIELDNNHRDEITMFSSHDPLAFARISSTR